jgi:nucleotide-binding universal stress UspA family protein
LIGLAHTLTPAPFGRLTVLSVVSGPDDWDPDRDEAPFRSAESVVRQAIATSLQLGIRVETTLVAARQPVIEVTQMANRIGCDLLVLGLSEISASQSGTRSEQMLSAARSDVVVLRAPAEWDIATVRRVLVLVAGQGGHDPLRARLLGSLVRTGPRQVVYLRVIPERASTEALFSARRETTRLTAVEMFDEAEVVVETDRDALAVAVRYAADADLVVLGVQRVGKRRLFGDFIRQLAVQSHCPMVVINHRR